ncbi:hypothetical protein J3Q64DRAFT_1712923 [Phycomyces blakesleeanus]|uniref:F-box domain-containing protein n=2 Tax=Phycomyces blakesleeanus TaxID=4837 RepID=A0A167K1U1_PHYB8|nr:hypothetical protein PHYBLDRAFT_78739 [Phycomyces blakesleeanus NRRL 1555(-)]OAD67086.1 hypothetical protein PHYBLDRAFT_78739 [Phycomyces blakesleeanus NRRL 1555(-)]|eukprot:XP_018285126.1 hypothetical protein PHYBLDRAFT_78739 [Phycomyces blakesleeanus NRRL 1555(-)]
MLTTELPFEILTVIAKSLQQNDKIICSTVCRTWKTPFQGSLWDTLTIDSEEKLNQICDLSTTRPTIYQLNGNKVQRLVFKAKVQTTEIQFHILQRLFKQLKEISIPHNTMREDSLGSIPDWKLWAALTTMLIYIKRLNDDDQKEQLFKILACLPCLKHLTIQDSIYYTLPPEPRDTWENLERLHETLPRLEYFHTDLLFGSIPVSEILKMKNIKPANTTTVVKLLNLNMDIGWIIYFSLKYPNIRTLKTRKPFKDTVLHEEQIPDAETSTMISSLSSNFPHLKSMVVTQKVPMGLDYDFFWETLQTQVKELQYLEYSLEISKRAGLETQNSGPHLIHFCSPTIQNFFIQLVAYYFDSPKVFLKFGACPRLVTLKIVHSGSNLELDTLLESCTSLKDLQLSGVFISLSPEAFNSTRTHGLRSLELKGSKTSPVTFNYLSLYCRDFDCMILYRARILGRISENTGELCLNMPFTDFKILRLVSTIFYAVENEENIFSEEPSGFHSLQILSIEETDHLRRSRNTKTADTESSSSDESPSLPIKRTWYHYHRDVKFWTSDGKTRKLGGKERQITEKFFETFLVSSQDPFNNVKKHILGGLGLSSRWEEDLYHGYSLLRCRSINEAFINDISHVDY